METATPVIQQRRTFREEREIELWNMGKGERERARERESEREREGERDVFRPDE